jgi:hypothetical protein
MRLRRILRTLYPPHWLRRLRWHRHQRSLHRRGWYDSGARSDSEAIFIGGCPRSGTTLLREILDRHPRLACGLETAVLVPPFDIGRIAERTRTDPAGLRRLEGECSTLVEFADRYYADLVARESKARWVDKTPANVRSIAQLLSWFPRGRFIHVVRDGRDVVCSLRDHPRQILVRGQPRSAGITNSIQVCARTWLEETSRGLSFRHHPRCLEVRYEELVTRPEKVIPAVCEFVDEAFHAQMLEPDQSSAGEGPPARLLNNPDAAGAISRASLGRWRRELDPADRRALADIAGELLVVLGYTDGCDWVDD